MTTDAAAPSRRWSRLVLPAILLVAFILRCGWGSSRPTDDASIHLLPDQSEYLQLARNLLAGNGLRFFDDRFKQDLWAYRVPGYPAFLAACGGQPLVARLVQAVVDTSTVWAAALLAGMFLPARSARGGSLLAAGLVALNPFLVYFSGLLLSETLFTAMLAWGMVLLVGGARGGRFGPEQGDPADVDAVPPAPYRPRAGTILWLSGGLLIALSAMVRPSAPPLTILLGVAASFAARPSDKSSSGRRRPAFKPRWPLPVATTRLLLVAAVLAPWAYRNSQVVKAWVWTTTNAGMTAYDGFNPDADGSSNQLVINALPQLKEMNEVERSEYLSARATRFAVENPKRAAQLALAKAGRTWSPVPLSDQFGSPAYVAVGLAYSVPFDLLVLVGLARGRVRRSAKFFLLVPALYFTAVHMASVGSLRYRVPVEPPLAALAAAGAMCVASGLRKETASVAS